MTLTVFGVHVKMDYIACDPSLRYQFCCMQYGKVFPALFNWAPRL